MSKINKQPNKPPLKPKKSPRMPSDQDGFYQKKPSWSFAICDLDHDCWGLCCEDNLLDIQSVILKLVSLEGQTWGQILTTPKGKGTGTKNHLIARNDIVKPAQSRLAEKNIWYDELYSIRINGNDRIWGVIQDGVFSIIWYDPKHEICPSLKKHT